MSNPSEPPPQAQPGHPVSGPADLRGQVAIVTGAGRGIGQAIARVLAEAGADIVTADLHPPDETVALIERLGRRVLHDHCDVSRRHDVERLVARAVEAFGRVDILVNNAGVVERTTLETLDEATFDREIDVILRGTVLCTQAVYPHMKAAGYGKIVNISSISGKLGGAVSRPGVGEAVPDASARPDGRSGPAYAAAKGGVIAFTKWVAKDAGRHGIYVNCVCPGPVDTAMTRGFDYSLSSQPIGRFGQPVDVAYAVLFFASAMSHYITGQTLNVDGGILMD